MEHLVFLGSNLIDEVPYTTDEVIAIHSQNDEKSIKKMIRTYREDLESFGVLRFEISKPKKGTKGGRPKKVFHLNEEQAVLLITYLDNTEPVRLFKMELVRQFFEMKKELMKRQFLKEAEKPIRKNLTDAIKEWDHFNSYAYSQITDLICKAVTGKITRVLKKERGIVGHVSALQLYSSEELEQYQRLENQVISLLELGLTYGEIKEILFKRKEIGNDKKPTYC